MTNSLDDLDEADAVFGGTLLKQLLTEIVAVGGKAQSLGPLKDDIDEVLSDVGGSRLTKATLVISRREQAGSRAGVLTPRALAAILRVALNAGQGRPVGFTYAWELLRGS